MRKPHLKQPIKFALFKTGISLVVFLFSIISCTPISRSDLFPLVMASPTTLSCSLEEIAPSVITPQPSSTKRSLDMTGISWSKYEDAHFGYSFEYPALYDAPFNRECALTVNPFGEKGQEVYIGSSVAMFIKQVQHGTWKDDACLLVLDLSYQSQLTMLNEVAFADQKGLAVAFNATWNPNGREILFQHDGLFYIITNINNQKCNIEGTAIEPSVVFQHMLDTFHFQSP